MPGLNASNKDFSSSGGGGNGEDLAVRRRRLRFRCWHRGTREMDLLLGRFADGAIETFDHNDLDCLDALLGQSDPDLYNWVTGRETPPPAYENRILDLLKQSHS